MTTIRPYRPSDLPALYEICLKTGDSGADGSHLYSDPKVIGEIYAAPYGVLNPGLAFVAEDEQGVAGYIVGCADTRAFEARLEAEWWPDRRALYADPSAVPPRERSWDQWRAWQIHHPATTPQAVVEAAPAHLHINMLPRLQGQGIGKGFVDTWRAAVAAEGAARVHLGCSISNHRALRFYDLYGFERLITDEKAGTVWMVMDTAA